MFLFKFMLLFIIWIDKTEKTQQKYALSEWKQKQKESEKNKLKLYPTQQRKLRY